jgi:Ca-activated chloride channel family protein
MSFLWPQALWLLLAAPALVGYYLLLLRRRKKAAVRYASLGLVREALGSGQRFRRHVPPLLFLLALIVLVVAVARPRATVVLPSEQRTIVLAMDVSLSMRASDVEPSRIEAAREAAKAFVKEQPADVRIGIVSFAGSAQLVQRPTRDRDDLVAAIDRLQLQLHTAIGSGIIVSLATLFPDQASTSRAPTSTFRRRVTRRAPSRSTSPRPRCSSRCHPDRTARPRSFCSPTDGARPARTRSTRRGWPPIAG